MPRLVARWPDETVIDKVAPRHTCHSMWKERRDCQRELESNLLPVRTWAGLLGPAGGVAHLHAVVSARRPAQTGMDRWTCGPCRHHRPRRRDLSHASGYRHQRGRKWSGVRPVSNLVDCVLGDRTVPGDIGDRSIRNHQGFNWEADLRFSPAGAFDRLRIRRIS